jgi:choice-of-anchor A domain-containing protein
MATPTGGNVSTTSDITGTLFASGDVSGNTFTLGQDLSGYPASSYSLTVLGNVSNQINVNAGSAFVNNGGNPIGGTLNFNEAGSKLYYDTSNTIQGTASTLFSQVNSATNAFTNMAATGNGAFNGSTYNLTYTGTGVAVFNLNASVFNTQNLNINLSAFAGGATSVVINVTGLPSSFNFGNTNFEGELDAQYASKILWNFEGYNSTITTSREFYGSILAPDAILTNGNAIDGSVWVQSIDANGEIHYADGQYVVQYSGFDPLAVPEPPTIVLTGIGAIGAAVMMMKNRNRGPRPPMLPAVVC